MNTKQNKQENHKKAYNQIAENQQSEEKDTLYDKEGTNKI
jgi:hypothetical protein